MIPSEPVPDAERAAGIITRGLAAVIDLLVILLIMSALYGGLVLVRLVYSPAAFSLPSLNAVFSTVVTFVVAVVYLTGCWTVSGSTAGAVAMGLRVVGDGRNECACPLDCCVRSAAWFSRSDCCGSWSTGDEDRCRTSSSAHGWSTRGRLPGDVRVGGRATSSGPG